MAPRGALPRWGDGRRLAVGLLGGSFDPGHAGHLLLALRLRRRLRLDQVWLLVSPGNPLKRTGAPFSQRLDSAARLADGRRIVATEIEAALGTRFSVDTVRALRRRFRRVRFVFLMGADNFAQLPRWHRWRALLRLVPIAVYPRAGATRVALAGQAATWARRGRRQAATATGLSGLRAPAWMMLTGPLSPLSSSALRQAACDTPRLDIHSGHADRSPGQKIDGDR